MIPIFLLSLWHITRSFELIISYLQIYLHKETNISFHSLNINYKLFEPSFKIFFFLT